MSCYELFSLIYSLLYMHRISSTDDIAERINRGLPDYKVISLIGEGGEGVVFLVQRRSDKVRFALKIILQLQEQTAQGFHREAYILRKINSHNVVKIYDYGEIDGLHYMILEYIKGGSLMDSIATHIHDDKSAARLGIHLCRGLYASHQAGVLHRDMKPDNVMMDSEGNPKLIDFGLAYCAGESLTDLNAVGSPGYAAPEIWDHPNQISLQTDIYATGAVFYTALTQTVPDPHNVNFNRLYDRDRRFIRVILKSMDKTSSKRYPSLMHMCDDLVDIYNTAGTGVDCFT